MHGRECDLSVHKDEVRTDFLLRKLSYNTNNPKLCAQKLLRKEKACSELLGVKKENTVMPL